MKKPLLYKIMVIVLVILMLAFVLFPVFWMLSTSFKAAGEVYSNPPGYIPKEPNLRGYVKLLTERSNSFNFLIWAKNSLIVALCTTLFSMAIAALGGFGLSRFRFRGRKGIMYTILMTQVLPGSLLIVPLYTIMSSLKLLDTTLGLVLANVTFAVPFCTWTMKGFFDSIPASLDEAARVDGAGRWVTFMHIVLPLTVPGLVATCIFSFITGWNEYLFASIFMRTYSKWTLPVGISSFQGQYGTDWPTIMAGAFMITIPVVFVFLVLQKYLVSGMTAGAVKQ